jgi:5-methyltetrahydrofolate--homocysteine methyltransferase
LNEAVGRFQLGKYFLAELIMAGDIIKECMKLLEPMMVTRNSKRKGSVVISGDLNSIGKDIVVT